jgi:cyanate permease
MSWQHTLVIWALIAGFGLLAIVPAFTRPRRRRNRKHNLPPPDSRTQRSPDWRRYELHTPRKYIP